MKSNVGKAELENILNTKYKNIYMYIYWRNFVFCSSSILKYFAQAWWAQAGCGQVRIPSNRFPRDGDVLSTSVDVLREHNNANKRLQLKSWIFKGHWRRLTQREDNDIYNVGNRQKRRRTHVLDTRQHGADTCEPVIADRSESRKRMEYGITSAYTHDHATLLDAATRWT